MPDYPESLIRKATEAAHADLCGCEGNGTYWTDPRYGYDRLARAVLDAVAADLGQHVAQKILAHMEAHGPATEGAEWTRRYRRYFGTAARVAAFAFLTGDDLKRMAATALAAAPEDSDG